LESLPPVIYVLVILLGLAVGSFLNVVIARFDDLASIIKTRSHCPKCKKMIPWYDLIPFFSYFILAGRCRTCKKTISIQYPLVEFSTALIFSLIYWKFGLSVESLFLFIISSILIVIAAYDWLKLEIPDILSYLAIFFALGLLFYKLASSGELGSPDSLLPYLYGLVVGLGFFGFLVVVSRQKWMGWGDCILASLMGILLGFPGILVALFWAFVLGSLVSLLLMALKQKTLKDQIPFAPFLVVGTFIALFWGGELINIYLLRFGL